MQIAFYDNFAGGLNEQKPPLIIEKQMGEGMFYAYDSKNWEMSEQGLIKYPGASTVLASAVSGTPDVTGIFEYRKSDGSIEMVVCMDDKIYTVAGDTETEILSGQTVGAYYQALNYNDILILCNGTDAPVQYNGTTCAAITFTDPQTIWNSATPKGAVEFNGRVMYWGDATNTRRIYTPKPGTHNDFDNSDYTVDAFDVDGGSEITGMEVVTNNLCTVFTLDSVKRLSGSTPFGQGIDDFLIRDVTTEVGCIAPRSIVNIGSDVFFLAANGLRRLSSVEAYGDLAHTRPTYKGQTSMNNLNYTAAQIVDAQAVYLPSENRIYLVAPLGSSSVNDCLITYDIMTDTVEKGEWLDASYIAVYNRKLYIGDYSGQLYLFNNGTSWGATTTIDGYWETFWIAHQGFSLKRYKRLIIHAESSAEASMVVKWGVLKRGKENFDQLTQTIVTSGGWDSGLWDTAVWSTGEKAVFEKKNLGRGKAFKLRISNNTNDERPKIRAIELHYEVFGHNKG